MKDSNGSGNTKKDCKSREKAGKGRVAAGSNIALLAHKVEAFEKKVFESQRSEEALRANQAILHATIENLPFGLFAIDENGYYFLRNPVCVKRWGNSVGKHFSQKPYPSETFM